MFTKEELAELAEYDKMVDKGADLYPLTKEQEQVSKKMRNIGEKTVKNTTKKPKTRKENVEKAQIIQKFVQLCAENYENVEILNKERQIAFTIGENKFELTLVQKRK